MINTTFFKSTLKQGIIMGFSFCLYTTLMWLTKLDTVYLSIGQYFDMAILILPILIILWAIKQENNLYTVTTVQKIIIAIFVGAVSYLIYDPFIYIYHNYINPDWFNSVLTLKEIDLNAVNIPHDKIVETLQKMKDSNVSQPGLFRLSTAIPSVIIIPTLIALISLIIVKRKK